MAPPIITNATRDPYTATISSTIEYKCITHHKFDTDPATTTQTVTCIMDVSGLYASWSNASTECIGEDDFIPNTNVFGDTLIQSLLHANLYHIWVCFYFYRSVIRVQNLGQPGDVLVVGRHWQA